MKNTNDYSFADVAPFMFTEYGRAMGINHEVLYAIKDMDQEFDLDNAFFDIFSPYPVKKSFNFTVPTFTGTHFKTKEKRQFNSKTFNIAVKSYKTENINNELLSQHVSVLSQIIDIDSGETMQFTTLYDNIHSLLNLDIKIVS